MNSCEYYQELLSSLVDGELSDEENEALMLHLNSCSRCNAMYAVFHDLSDILSEDPEPLPEGLHENIMAGVRRSEIMKKNRRMRRIGLRTAMTAAACAVLVLFAAVSFDPGRRADSVSIHSEQEAMELLPTPSPVTGTPAADVYALPAATPVPAQTPSTAPAQTPAAAYDTAGSAAYTPVQPEQYNPYSYDSYQEAAPLPAWTPTPASVWTPAPETYTQPAWTPAPETPAPVWTPAPAPAVTTVPASTLAPAPAETAAAETTTTVYEMSDQTAFSAAPVEEAPSVMMTQNPAMQARAADPVPTQDPEDAADYGADEVQTEEETVTFSLFSSMMDLFDAAPSDQLTDAKLTAPAGIETVLDALGPDNSEESPAPSVSGMPLEIVQEEEKPAAEEHVTAYGNDARTKLLAMIGKNVDTLPQEAELTRLVHVKLLPDDAYGSEEKMDIAIYGDFVYCTLYPVEGGSVTYKADCSLKELNSFLKTCASDPAPSAAPTPDPYSDPTPVPSPDGSAAENTPTE